MHSNPCIISANWVSSYVIVVNNPHLSPEIITQVTCDEISIKFCLLGWIRFTDT